MFGEGIVNDAVSILIFETIMKVFDSSKKKNKSDSFKTEEPG